MHELKYSFLMSVYCKENPEWLRISIKSMIEQTYAPNEIVIVEDGVLGEELENVICSFVKNYGDLFKIIKLEQNQGLGKALGIGVINCKNDWIARMDSDDYSTSNRCEKQILKINELGNVDIVGSCVSEYLDSKDNVISHRVMPESHEEIVKYSRRRNPFAHPTVFLRKEKVLEAGNYQDAYLCEDYDLWTRMIEKGAKGYNCSDYLVMMRVSKDFYRRRGGIKYLKSMLKLKKKLYNRGYYSLKDLVISGGSHIIMCLIPGFLRDRLYRKFLRKRSHNE